MSHKTVPTNELINDSDRAALNANFRVNKEFATNLYKKQYNKPIDPNSTASLPQTTRQFISRLDLIKKDNDEIRKKYQNLNYEYQANILNEKPRRRYEELYLQNGNSFYNM